MKAAQRWYRRHQLFNRDIPAGLLPWLFEVSSLTAKLVDLCGDDFNVRVLSQSWQSMSAEEADAMSVRHVHAALVREVLLCRKDQPLVYARTVIPATTVKGAQRRYANMGNRPLGAMLFADRTMRREEVQVARLPKEHAACLYGDCEQDIWGRRSVFRVAGRPLLVSEYFLPALLSGD